ADSGRKLQRRRLTQRLRRGASRKTRPSGVSLGRRVSFRSSLRPSAKGWPTPSNPTRSGPSRRWWSPISFRSTRVKAAVNTSTPTSSPSPKRDASRRVKGVMLVVDGVDFGDIEADQGQEDEHLQQGHQELQQQDGPHQQQPPQ